MNKFKPIAIIVVVALVAIGIASRVPQLRKLVFGS